MNTMTTIAWINHAVMRPLKTSSTKSALIHQSLNNGPVQKKTDRDAMAETREPDRGRGRPDDEADSIQRVKQNQL